jgi:hypothetical protein
MLADVADTWVKIEIAKKGVYDAKEGGRVYLLESLGVCTGLNRSV